MMEMLLVLLLVEMGQVFVAQSAVTARLLFTCKVKLPVFGQDTMKLLAVWAMLRFGGGSEYGANPKNAFDSPVRPGPSVGSTVMGLNVSTALLG